MEAESKAEVVLSKVVIRCGCGDPMSHALRGWPCPYPRAIEEYDKIPKVGRRRIPWQT